MQLRPYQQAAVDAVYRYLRDRDDNPCVVIPTAGGKTPILATIVRDALCRWQGRVLILSHVRELLQQAVDKITTIFPDCDIGVYSSGLNSRETQKQCIVAGIQSVYRRASELGKFDLVIVDEAHLIPINGEGMYQKFLAEMKEINPIIRVIGLTATPYRMSTGTICAPDNILNEVCFEVGIKELMRDGYLCKLRSKSTRHVVDTGGLRIRGGEFVDSEAEELMDRKELVESACAEIAGYTRERKSVLVFCCGVKHAKNVLAELRKFSDSAEAVFGDTLPGFREGCLENFKAGRIKYLVNVGVLTTGFDAPNVDCVVLLRPTASPGLYYQMVGRGFRLHPDKPDCLVLDFGGNIVRHGPVDCIRAENRDNGRKKGEALGKTCPRCQETIAINAGICPCCGHVFAPAKKKAAHDQEPSNAPVISGEVSEEEYEVQSVRFSVHEKRDAPPDAPKTVRIDYRINMIQSFSEWICPEHSGYVRRKFVEWWREHASGGVPPSTAAEAVWLANEGAVKLPTHITVRSVAGEKFPRISGRRYAPETQHPETETDEIPF